MYKRQVVDVIEESFNVHIDYIVKLVPLGESIRIGNRIFCAPTRSEPDVYKRQVFISATNLKLFYLRSINPMIEKMNPTIPIPITSSPIPDEQRDCLLYTSRCV